MSEPGGACLGCGGALRIGAAFCAGCGLRVGELALSEAPAVAPTELREERWQALRPALLLFGWLLAISFVGMLAYKVDRSPWIDVGMSLATSIIVLVFVWRDRMALAESLTVSPWARLPVGKALLVLAGTVLGIRAYFALLTQAGVPFLSSTEDVLAAGWPVWTAYALTSLHPAIFEELAFRGVIWSRLRSALGETEAWLVQAAMFSVLHLFPLIFPSHFVMGLAFGWLRRASGSLYPGIVAHALWNGWVVWRELAER